MRGLNHPKVTPFTRKIASQLRLDPTFVNFVFAKERRKCFRNWCEDAEGGWTCFVPDSVTAAFPLWSTNADQTLLLISGNEISYGMGYHDNPDIEMISQTSQGLLADLLNRVLESEASEEAMRAAAQCCGFRYLTEYLAFVNAPVPDGVGWEQNWRLFVSEIDAKST
jgi:hypothetical protein